MKIAYLSSFYPLRGGIAQFNAALYRVFEKEHEIKAFTFKRQYPNFLFPGTSQYVTENDIADKIPSIETLDTINPFSFITTGAKISKFSPDLVLTKFWMPFFGPSLGWVLKKSRKNGSVNISILDNVIPHEMRPGDKFLIRYFLKRNDGFIVMSDSVKEDLLKMKPDAVYSFNPHPLYDHFGKKPEQSDARKRLNIPQDKNVLLFFGFIRLYKGLDILLEAMQYLPENYLLIIAGEVYGDFNEYDELIKKYGLESKVQMHIRYISDNEVPDFFSAADVCVLPYKSGTQSGITSIAFHFDLPVIATDVGGLKESIEPYMTGMIVDEPRSNMLNAAITDYFEFNLKEKFIPNIQKFRKLSSWETMAQSIIDLYKKLKK